MTFNKPKFWDYKKQNLISYFLLPFTFPLILNNFLLSKKSKKKYENIKTICVGNIYLGGTGKTPTSIKLKQILDDLNINSVIGKKFYSAHLDERILIEKKSKLIIGKNRLEIIKLAIKNNYDCLIFDDGLQDKNIKYDLEFVCFDAAKWLGNGNLIPSGPLREKISSLKKYDAVFLKNCQTDLNIIENNIKKINPEIKIFKVNYKPTNINEFDLDKEYLVFSGIGNPESFKNTLIENKFKIIKELTFPDHFDYSKKTIYSIKKEAQDLNAQIITTEKDFVKIQNENNRDIGFLKMDLEITNEDDLINLINSKINENN
jgi:tetraacyldisaccharide 4'-kinase